MEWSKLKTKGINPSPRSGHAGVLVGDKWFIAGGENRGFGACKTLSPSKHFCHRYLVSIVVRTTTEVPQIELDL